MTTRRAGAGLLLLLAVGACANRDVSPGELSYVGGSACVECHQAEARLWAGSDHDLAMQPATPESVLGDFDDRTFVHDGVTSTFFRREDDFFVRTDGPNGALAEYRVAYTFGVEPLQQYLISFPGGRYQVLGIAWDARPEGAGGQRWYSLYPDDHEGSASPLHWTRPSQRWNTVCAECHSTNLQKGFDAATGAFATTWSDLDVSCEACHGPGSRHVEIARGAQAGPAEEASAGDGPSERRSRPGAKVSGGDWGLVNGLRSVDRVWTLAPGASTATRAQPLGTRVEVETCAPCHARRATLATDHVPGSPALSSYAVSLLRPDLYHPDGQILDEVYVYGSFLQSRMYRAGVTCSNCHEPHALHLRAEGNALCTRCHSARVFDVPDHTLHEASSEGARCVACHMPTTTYMGVDQRRDHSLRVPRPDLTRELGVPNACGGCHGDRPDGWAEDALAGRVRDDQAQTSYAEAVAAGRRGDPTVMADLAAIAADTSVSAIRRGTALSLLAGQAPSRTTPAISAGLGDPEPFVRLGALQALDGFPAGSLMALASPLLDDSLGAVRAEAARLLTLRGGTGTDVAQADARRRATEEFERTQRVNADYSSSWVNLGDMYASLGRAAEAEDAYRKAIELDATDWVARLDLADFQRALGRDDLARETLEAALDLTPDAPELLHAVGLLLVREGQLEAALEWLTRAAELRPDNGRFSYVLGVALWSSDEREGAVDVLEDALSAHPFDRDILAALASYAAELGETEEAQGYARRLVALLPDDPGAAELLRRLGG